MAAMASDSLHLPADLSAYVGRRCVYIEDGVFSIARVSSVRVSEEGMGAVLQRIEAMPLVCYYRERPPRFAEEIPCDAGRGYPEATSWEVAKGWRLFFLDEDYWDGSLYMGFRALFAPAVVERFLARDLSWTEDYF